MKRDELQALADNQRLLRDVLGDALFHKLLGNGTFNKTPTLAVNDLKIEMDRMAKAIA